MCISVMQSGYKSLTHTVYNYVLKVHFYPKSGVFFKFPFGEAYQKQRIGIQNAYFFTPLFWADWPSQLAISDGAKWDHFEGPKRFFRPSRVILIMGRVFHANGIPCGSFQLLLKYLYRHEILNVYPFTTQMQLQNRMNTRKVEGCLNMERMLGGKKRDFSSFLMENLERLATSEIKNMIRSQQHPSQNWNLCLDFVRPFTWWLKLIE